MPLVHSERILKIDATSKNSAYIALAIDIFTTLVCEKIFKPNISNIAKKINYTFAQLCIG
jgi:hypothetical protein